MSDDDFDILAPDPLLAASDGDEAPDLVGSKAWSARQWLGAAAGFGIGSAAITAAVMFWGRKEQPDQRRGGDRNPRKSNRPKAHSSAAED
jgi:hypothetical protein